MAAEPWIDHTDPEYWQELIQADLDSARTVYKAHKYFMVGLKCYEAVVNTLCCWFVSHHSVKELPEVTSPTEFSKKVGFFGELTQEQIMLMERLDAFKVASHSSEKREEFCLGLTPEYCESILEGTKEFSALARTSGI